ncbi:MAG: cupin domain-containing protein [Mycobacterium sp.]|jgi:uncharacterized cupin superfamily protein|nr:cupin domain-containing protein [Mycobacterium sp.]
MKANSVVHAGTVDVELQPVPADQTKAGSPRTGTEAVGEFDGLEIGVWEMSPGTMWDVELNEIFVVISGAATVDFADGSPQLQLGPGDVVRLAEGTETVWTVTETLRKVYLT